MTAPKLSRITSTDSNSVDVLGSVGWSLGSAEPTRGVVVIQARAERFQWEHPMDPSEARRMAAALMQWADYIEQSNTALMEASNG